MTEIERLYPEPGEPMPSEPGRTGRGQSIKWHNGYYYYRIGCYIPKNKAVSLVHESGYCGRQNGDKDWIIVAWNGENFSVLEHVMIGLRKELSKYKGMTAEEAIDHMEALEAKREDEWKKVMEKFPKCVKCGSPFIQLYDEICCKCLTSGKKEK